MLRGHNKWLVLTKRATNVLLLVLDFDLETLDGIGRLGHNDEGFPSEGLQEDLHASGQVEGRVLMDVVR